MAGFDDLKSRYMLTVPQGGSLFGSSDVSIVTYTNNLITPLIKGPTYFQAIKKEIEGLSGGPGQFIYIAGWWIGPTFSLDVPSGMKFSDLLKQKSRQGVDVRVLGWVMAPETLRLQEPGLASAYRTNGETMNFIKDLRTEPTLKEKACLNILAHPVGATHLKMAIVGSNDQAVGFTGGIDFEPHRQLAMWHDVEAQVTGPVVQGLFDAFQKMWMEVRSRAPETGLTVPGVSCDSHTSSMPDLPPRAIKSTSGGKMHAQSVRTLPKFNFSTIAGFGASAAGKKLPTNKPLSYAPDGLFEIQAVWQKGISGAQAYIYMEDQGFWSQEVFDWVNAAIKKNDSLRVVLLTGRGDPNDTPTGNEEKFFRIAINKHLLKDLSRAQIDRVGVFNHKDKLIHTKSTIVDDQWAIIGSANCFRRSLYTDFEHAVAYMDEDGRGVPSYRANLWSVHLGSSPPDAVTAVSAWFALPFQTGDPTRDPVVTRAKLPFPETGLKLDDTVQILYDELQDPDSRQAWGSGLAKLLLTVQINKTLSGTTP